MRRLDYLKKLFFPLIIILSIPFQILAGVKPGLDTIIIRISGLVNTAVPIFFTLALIVFIWGVIKYVLAGGDTEKKKQGMSLIMYGIIGLFAIFAVWGLVKVIANTFSIDTGGSMEIPEISY